MWDLGNSNAKVLDYSNSATNGSAEPGPVEEFDPDTVRKHNLGRCVCAKRSFWGSAERLRLAEKVLKNANLQHSAAP